MPLEWTNIELVLRGVQQKADDVTRPPDRLKHAINVEFDKDGVLNKRRGYQHVDLSNTVNLFDDDEVFVNVTTFRGELVVFSYDHVCAVGSRDSAMRGTDALIYRGPNNRVSCSLEFVTTANLTRNPDTALGEA
jgi:hypothetical protein